MMCRPSWGAVNELSTCTCVKDAGLIHQAYVARVILIDGIEDFLKLSLAAKSHHSLWADLEELIKVEPLIPIDISF